MANRKQSPYDIKRFYQKSADAKLDDAFKEIEEKLKGKKDETDKQKQK